MLEIVPDEMTTRTLETVESEIILLRDQTARNMLEIGKRLTEAQGLVPRGGWKVWLSEHVGFSYRTAARMMAAYREFGDNPALGRLDSAKLYALLDAPEAIRQEMMDAPEAIEGKSVRQLQTEIKARKAAEARVAELEAGLDAALDKSEAAIEAAKREGYRAAVEEIGRMETRLCESQAREQAARAALMNAQLVKPDTALAAENARLQAELLKAHDALNQMKDDRATASRATDGGWDEWQKQVNARAQAALDGMVRGWLCGYRVYKSARGADGRPDFAAVCDWAADMSGNVRETAWGRWKCGGDGRFFFSTPVMGGASMELTIQQIAQMLEEMYFID